MKLTPRQNEVIWCLQNGWILIANSEHKGAWVSKDGGGQYGIGTRLFWNLVDLGLIYQGGERHGFSYILTPLGLEVKTKPVYYKIF